ncbi:maleylacetoacetate isomerase [Altericroceibacterium xinjiangense]|uniref:maleylacetoacetate isomerase n=1 Tax=Altericroceibacterium xinjiangense TaxID=762261 RepID=UPI001F49D147|nr:maleylacetoacetate isomerase [Altericroceibacterium xinjiangense]
MSETRDLVLHGYWRSGTSYRTRIALNLKNVEYRQVPRDLRTGDQRSDDFRALNPQGLVPALVAGTTALTQSSAILEWLEETYPDPPLLPESADDRAIVRAMAMTVACDIHPLNNLRVLQALTQDMGVDDAGKSRWIARWIADGFAALEVSIRQHGGEYAFGDTLTLADCHLVPQVYSARRFNVSLDAYPALCAAATRAERVPEVAAAHPDRQPDADRPG